MVAGTREHGLVTASKRDAGALERLWQSLEGGVIEAAPLNAANGARKERYVLAAIQDFGQVSVMFTPKAALESSVAPCEITAQRPDAFLSALYNRASEATASIVLDQTAARRKPSRTPDTTVRHVPTLVRLSSANGAD
jgi:hypothetical protein